MSDNIDRNIWDAIGDIDDSNEPDRSAEKEESNSAIAGEKSDSSDKSLGDVNGNEEKNNRTLMIPSLNSLRDKLGFRSKEIERNKVIMKPATVRSQETDATANTPVNRHKTPRSPENIFDKAFGFMKAVKPVLQGSGATSGTGSPSPSPSPTPEANRNLVSSPAVNGDPPVQATMEAVYPLDLSKASRTIKVPKQFKKSSASTDSNDETDSRSRDSPLDLSFKKRPGDDINDGPPVKKMGVESLEMPGPSGVATNKVKTECLAKPSPHRTSIFPKPAHTNSDSLRRQSGVHGGSAPPPIVTALPFRSTPRWNAALPGNANHEPAMKAVKVSPVRPHIKGKPVYEVRAMERKDNPVVERNSDPGVMNDDTQVTKSHTITSPSVSPGSVALKSDNPQSNIRVAMHNLPVQCVQATISKVGHMVTPVPAARRTCASSVRPQFPSAHHKVLIRDGKVQYSIPNCQTKSAKIASPGKAVKKTSPSKAAEIKNAPPTLLNVPVFKPLERKPAKNQKTVGLSSPMKIVTPVLTTCATATATVTTTNMVTSTASSVAETVVAFSSPVMSSSTVATNSQMHRLTLSELTQKLAVQLKTVLPDESSNPASPSPSSTPPCSSVACSPVDVPASVSKNVPVIQKPASPSPNAAKNSFPKHSDKAKTDLPTVMDKSKDLQPKSLRPPSIPVIGQGPIMAARKSTAKPTRLPFMCARKSTALPQKSAKRAAKLQRMKAESSKLESPPRLMVISPERTINPSPPLLPSPPMPLLSPSTPVSKIGPNLTSDAAPQTLTEVCEGVPPRQDPVHSTDSAGSTPAHDNDSDVSFKPASSSGLYPSVLKRKGPVNIPSNDEMSQDGSCTSTDESSAPPTFTDKKCSISKFTLSILGSGKDSNKDSSLDDLRISKFKSPCKKEVVKPGSPRRRPVAMLRKKPSLHVPDLASYSDFPVSKLSAFMPTRSADLSPISWSVVSTTCSMKDAIVTLTQAKSPLPTSDISSTRYYQNSVLKQSPGDKSRCPSPLSPLSITIPPNQSPHELICPAIKKPTIKPKVNVPIVAKDWKESTTKYKRDVLLMPKKLIYVPRKTPKGFKTMVMPVPAQMKKKTSSINKMITKVSREAFRKAKRLAKKSSGNDEGVTVHKKKRKRKKKLNVDVQSAKAAADEEAARKAYSIVPSPDGSSTKITIIHSPVSAAIISPMSAGVSPELRKMKKVEDPSTSGVEVKSDTHKCKKSKQKEGIKKLKAGAPTTRLAELVQPDANFIPKITIKTSPRATSPRGGDFDCSTLGSPRQGSPRQSSPRSVRTPSVGTTTEACTTLIHDISPESSSPCPKVKITFKTVPKTSPHGGEPQKSHPPTPKVTIRTGPLRKDPDTPMTPVTPQREPELPVLRKDAEKEIEKPPQKMPELTRIEKGPQKMPELSCSIEEESQQTRELAGSIPKSTQKTPELTIGESPQKTQELTHTVGESPQKTPELTHTVGESPQKTPELTHCIEKGPPKTAELADIQKIEKGPQKTQELTESISKSPQKTLELTSSIKKNPRETPELTDCIEKGPQPTPELTESIPKSPQKTPELTSSMKKNPQETTELTGNIKKSPQKTPGLTRRDIENKIKNITRRDIELGLLNARKAVDMEKVAVESQQDKTIIVSSEEELSQQGLIITQESAAVNKIKVKEEISEDKDLKAVKKVKSAKVKSEKVKAPKVKSESDNKESGKSSKKTKTKKSSLEGYKTPKALSEKVQNRRSRSPVKRQKSVGSKNHSRDASQSSKKSVSLEKHAKLERKASLSSIKSLGTKAASPSGKSTGKRNHGAKKPRRGLSRSSSCASRSLSPLSNHSKSPVKKSQSKSPVKGSKHRNVSPGKTSRSSSKQSRSSRKLSRSRSRDSRLQRSCSASSTKSDDTIRSEDFSTPKNRRETARERREREELKKKKKRSLLDELVNSDGYIADKKCDRRSDTLWAAPSKLSREERALQRAMLQFTKMELGIEVKNKPGPSSQLSPMSCVSSSSSTRASPEGLASPDSTTSSKGTETPKTSGSQPQSGSRSLASMKAKSLKDRALKRSRDDKNNKNRNVSPKKSSFEDFKPTILESRTRRQAHVTRSSESSEEPSPGPSGHSSRSRNRSGRDSRRSCVASLSYKDEFEEDYEEMDCSVEEVSSSPVNSAKKKSRSVHMKLVQKAAHVARDFMKKKRQKSSQERRKLEEKRKVLAAQYNPWANDYEDMVYDLPQSDHVLEVIDASSQAGSSASSQDHVPPEVKKISVVRETGENLLHKAARLGYKEATLWCCENKYVNLNGKDHAGYAPLHEASTTGNVTIAKYLIAYGAEVNVGSLDGVRPLHDAVENNHFEMVRLLLSCGADIHLATYSGKKVLDLARTPEMKALIEGYLADMNGTADDETNIKAWELPQIPPPPEEDSDDERSNSEKEQEPEELDPMETCGYDIFADIPSDDDFDCVDVEFQFSSRPHLSSYYIRASRDDIPRNYVLLRDVVERLGVSRQDLVSAHPGLYVINLSINAFLCAVNSSQLCYRSKHLTLEPRHNSIELVELDATLHDILDVDIVTIRDHRRHRRKRKQHKKKKNWLPDERSDPLSDNEDCLELDTTTELDLSGETVEGVSYEERAAKGPGDLVPGRSMDYEVSVEVGDSHNIDGNKSVSLIDDLVIEATQSTEHTADSSVSQSNEASGYTQEETPVTDMGTSEGVSDSMEYPTDNADFFMHQDNNATDEDNIYIDEGSQKDGDDIDVEIISDTESPIAKTKPEQPPNIPVVSEPEIVEIPDSPPRPVEKPVFVEKVKVSPSHRERPNSSPEKRDRKREKSRRTEGPKTIQLRPSRLDHLDRQRLQDKRMQENRFQTLDRPFDLRDEERPAFTFPSLHTLPGTSMYTSADLTRMLHSSSASYTPSPSIHAVPAMHPPPPMYPTLPLHQQLHSPMPNLHYPRTTDISVPMPLAPPGAPVMSFLSRSFISDSQPTYIPHDVTSYLLPPPTFPTPPMLQPSAPAPQNQDKAPVQLQILDIASLAQHSAAHPGMHHLGH